MFSPKLVMLTNTDMKILKSSTISSFKGLNFVIEEAINLKINNLLNSSLPNLPTQSRYNWFDIIMSYWSVFFCGGNCAEDLSINLKDGFHDCPILNVPSPDRVLNRVKSLSNPAQFYTTERGKMEHHFSLARELNRLNIKMLPNRKNRIHPAKQVSDLNLHGTAYEIRKGLAL